MDVRCILRTTLTVNLVPVQFLRQSTNGGYTRTNGQRGIDTLHRERTISAFVGFETALEDYKRRDLARFYLSLNPISNKPQVLHVRVSRCASSCRQVTETTAVSVTYKCARYTNHTHLQQGARAHAKNSHRPQNTSTTSSTAELDTATRKITPTHT